MKIYSYYCPVPELNMIDEIRLTFLWRERWAKAGFEPVILNEWTAMKHPAFERLSNRAKVWPTSNPKDSYERACWLRWLALAVVGGGFASDLDVMPVKPLPKPTRGKLCCYQAKNCCPSLIWADPPALEKLAAYFLSYDPGTRTQVSDQYAIEQLAMDKVEWVRVIDFVRLYAPGEGFETAGAIHFANSAMGPQQLTPRWKTIPGILDNLAK